MKILRKIFLFTFLCFFISCSKYLPVEYSLTVNPSPPEGGFVNPRTGIYVAGQTVNILASANQLKVGNSSNGDGIYQIITHSSSQSNLTALEVYNITSSIDVSNYPNLNLLNVQNGNRNICIQVSQDQLDNIGSLNFYKDFRDTFSLNCN